MTAKTSGQAQNVRLSTLSTLSTSRNLLKTLAERGIEVGLGERAPFVTPAEQLQPGDREQLAEHRDGIIAALQAAETAAVLRSLSQAATVGWGVIYGAVRQDSRSWSKIRVATEALDAAAGDIPAFRAALERFRAAWEYALRRAAPVVAEFAVTPENECGKCGTRVSRMFVEFKGEIKDLRPWFLCGNVGRCDRSVHTGQHGQGRGSDRAQALRGRRCAHGGECRGGGGAEGGSRMVHHGLRSDRRSHRQAQGRCRGGG